MSAEAELIELREPPRPTVARWWEVTERGLVWIGNRLNPILVKETRQALKSKQFAITFGLLLALGWGWSILGVAWIGPDIYHSAQGPDMFIVYYLILSFPLLVIVPFSAFRSLASEQEDRTYELLSITSLGPRQIIRGKLGSAVLQMVVYLSAISPCLAFTYMLRGIDFLTILFMLFWITVVSLGLAVVGLLAGTLTTEKHWQVVFSVVLIAGLLFVFFFNWGISAAALTELEFTYAEPEFWQANAAVLTALASFIVLFFYAAAAQITFASDNRSTRLRATMAVQQLLYVGWMAWLWVTEARGDEDLLYGGFSLALGYWFLMGMFLTGESAELSPRVKRDLPQSFLGRAFLTWFNPGPGTGYVFVMCNVLALTALIGVSVAVADANTFHALRRWSVGEGAQVLGYVALGTGYLVIFLGLGLLLVRFLRRFTYAGLMLSVMVNPLLVLLGMFIPLVLSWIVEDFRYMDYSLLHASNPFWSMAEFWDRSFSGEMTTLLVLVLGGAAVVAVANARGIARELRHVRLAKPKRVAAEDAEREAALHPIIPEPTSPFDGPEPT